MIIAIDIRPLFGTKRTGVGEYTVELVSALLRNFSEHTFVLFYNSFLDVSGEIPKDWLSKSHVHIVSSRIPNKFFHFSLALFRLPKIDQWIIRLLRKQGLHEIKLDILFSPNLHFTAVSTTTPFVFTLHDLSFEHFRECYSMRRRLWHSILNPRRQTRTATHILTPSDHTRRDLIETYGVATEKVTTIYPALPKNFEQVILSDKKAIQEKYHLPNRYIFFLGTIEPRKNIEGLLAAYEKSGLYKRGIGLVIAGACGWMYKSILDHIEATHGALYIGYVDAVEKPILYHLASVFAYPSLYEGFGFPVLEAMAVGTSVVTSNRSSLPEIVNTAVHLVNPYRIEEIASALIDCVDNTALKKLYVEQGKKRAIEFSWDNAAKEWIDIMEKIIH